MIQNKTVRSCPSADDHFAKSQGRVDEHLVSGAGHGVGGEQDTRYLRGNQMLDHDGDRDPIVAKPLALPVANGSCRPQRSPAALDRFF
jgi:hypothetical protein